MSAQHTALLCSPRLLDRDACQADARVRSTSGVRGDPADESLRPRAEFLARGDGGTLEMAEHGAAASAAGYLYQTDWALVDLLRKGHTRPDQAITLELHDDVAWTSDADASDPVELLQIKLHATTRAAGLGDMAVDIWKTLQIWMDRPDATDPQGPDLNLVTTSVATVGSAAFALRPATRDVDVALDKLLVAARNSANEETRRARESFTAMDRADVMSLLERVRILDGQMPPEDLDAAVRETLAYALPSGGPAVEDRFIAQVWHYWARISIDLLRGRRPMITVTEVRTYIRELRDRYTTENLPTTVAISAVTDDHIELYSGARFVLQLELVDYAGPSLRNAIIDYHRAITQETEWLSDNLLAIHELQQFEEELRFEWSREFHNMVQDLELDHLDPEDAEKVKRKAGRKLLNHLLQSTAVTVRTHYNEGFYGRGKRHELAGHETATQRIGWHPDFAERLEALATTI